MGVHGRTLGSPIARWSRRKIIFEQDDALCAQLALPHVILDLLVDQCRLAASGKQRRNLFTRHRHESSSRSLSFKNGNLSNHWRELL
jgi:hypothetical protein